MSVRITKMKSTKQAFVCNIIISYSPKREYGESCGNPEMSDDQSLSAMRAYRTPS